MTVTERDIAQQIAAGTLPSPTEFLGSTFFAVRFSGTGVAWRESIGEFCYRDPGLWLSPAMCGRIVGCPLIAEHPDKGALDGPEFAARVAGVLTYGFTRADALWSIARVIDADVATAMNSGAFDTSPAVLFFPADNELIELSGGEKLLVEGEPALIDHLALIFTGDGNQGVWGAKSNEIGIQTKGTDQ